MRDRAMLQAIILAELRESQVDSMSCDQLCELLAWGRGQVIAACDELAKLGYLVKDRGVVALTSLALEQLAEVEADRPEAA